MTTNTPPRVPMSSPDLSQAEIDAVLSVLGTPNLSMGPCIDRFEAAFRQFTGCRHAIGVNSGTAGLHLCVRAAGIGPGDLVITTPFSFVASTNVILFEQAIPVFVDVDPQTGNIDPALVRQAAATWRRAEQQPSAGCRARVPDEPGPAESPAGGGCVRSAGGFRCPANASRDAVRPDS